jgi:hypothetical protein
MPRRLRVSLHTFRTFNHPLSGELYVTGGSSRRRGARQGRNPAKETTSMSCAGSDDGDGPTAGGSAHTSAAHATGPDSSADIASTDGAPVKRAPKEGEQWVRRIEYPETELMPARSLAKDGYDFVKEVNMEVQLAAITKERLTSLDEKVSLKILQQLLTIAFGRGSRSRADRPRRYIDNLPGPESE